MYPPRKKKPPFVGDPFDVEISLYAAIRGVTKEEAKVVGEERLRHVRLWDRREGRVGAFSGGMRRRLSMVLSTIGDPKLVILDEVTTGLDPVSTLPFRIRTNLEVPATAGISSNISKRED
jgi:energy-coupling factor transporter ATP-binding protein EcfA2